MADEPVTLDQVKQHLRLDATDQAEEAYLAILISAARRSIENYTGKVIRATWPSLKEDDRSVVTQAVLLLVGDWYTNREAGQAGDGAMSPAVRWLIAPLKRWRL